MGVLCDYFAAGSDAEAASVVDRPGGPAAGSAAGEVVGHRDGASTGLVVTAASPPRMDTVSGWKIDPVVQLATLQEILTGRPYDDIVAEPRSGRDLAVRDGGARLVLTLADSLLTALAEASDAQLATAAVGWARTEEFWGEGDPAQLTVFLGELAALARRASSRGQRLYCWVCV